MELILLVTNPTTGGVAPIIAPVTLNSSVVLFHSLYSMETSQDQDSFRRLRRAVSASDSTIDNGTGSLVVGGANILSRWRQWQLGSFHLIKVVLGRTVAAQGGSGYHTHHRKLRQLDKLQVTTTNTRV